MAMSQKQIDELLKGKKEKEKAEAAEIAASGSDKSQYKSVKPYNFLNPKRYQKEQLKMLDNIFDNMARFIGSQLTTLLRISCTAKVSEIQEMKFKDYSNIVGEYALIGIIGLTSPDAGITDKQELMIIDKHISFAMMDYMLGGDGSCYNIDREYTDIELAIMTNLLKQLAPKHNSVWTNYVDMERKMKMIETSLRMIQSISVDETIVDLVFELNIKDLHGNMHICIPADTMDALLGIFHSKAAKSAHAEDDSNSVARKKIIMDTLKQSTLDVTGVLGTTEIHVQELLDLQPGDIFLLNDASKENSVKVNIAGQPWFSGKIGVHKKNYAVKITDTLNSKDGSNI